MKISESSIRRFLENKSHERFAKLYLKHTKTPLIVLSKKEIFMYNPEFKYYQLVEQGGRLLHLVSDVLHTALETFHSHFTNKYADANANKELEKDDKNEVLTEMKTIIKQINVAIKNIETTTFIKNVNKLLDYPFFQGNNKKNLIDLIIFLTSAMANLI